MLIFNQHCHLQILLQDLYHPTLITHNQAISFIRFVIFKPFFGEVLLIKYTSSY